MNEIISLDKITEIRQNGVLSQKLTAVTPSGLDWLFFTPKHRPTCHWFRRKPTIYRPPHRQNRIGACFPLWCG